MKWKHFRILHDRDFTFRVHLTVSVACPVLSISPTPLSSDNTRVSPAKYDDDDASADGDAGDGVC